MQIKRVKVHARGMPPPQKIFGFLHDLLRSSLHILGVKLQKLDDFLLNLVFVFEARRIKGVTLLHAAEAAKPGPVTK